MSPVIDFSTAPLMLRWGQSPYEQGEKLLIERSQVEELGFRTLYCPGEVFPLELKDASVLVVTSMKRVGPAELDQAPALKLLVTTTSGYDHLDLVAARDRGITVARCPLARRDAVVESALGMALALLKDLPGLNDQARDGRWVRADLPGRGIELLSGLPVGVVGLGVIGSRMATVLGALGARVFGHDPRVTLTQAPAIPLDEMMSRCRVVTLHCSLEAGAPPTIDRVLLEKARSDMILINTARGGVLALKAAWERLRTGRLGALGVDVFPTEPWPELAELSAHPRVLLTPHGAGYHGRLGESIAEELIEILRAWKAGEPIPHRVTGN